MTGHAYAINPAGVFDGSVYAAVRNEDYALFVNVVFPKGPEVRQAESYAQNYEGESDEELRKVGLDKKSIESRRVLPYKDAELVEWTITEYVQTVYEAVEKKLGE